MAQVLYLLTTEAKAALTKDINGTVNGALLIWVCFGFFIGRKLIYVEISTHLKSHINVFVQQHSTHTHILTPLH